MSASTNKRKKTAVNRQRRIAQKKRKNATKALSSNLPLLSKPQLHIAPCTKIYLRSLVDPFGTAEQPCIPDGIILPSFKYRCSSRGVMTTGTAGTGYVAFNPFTAFITDPFTYQPYSDPIFYTTVGYTDPNINWAPPGTPQPTGVGTAHSNSMFTYADFTTTTQVRLVSAAVKVRYTGTDFRNQGQVVLYRGIGNVAPPVLPVDMAGLLTVTTSVQLPVRRSEEYLFYVPDSPVLLGYRTAGNMINPGYDQRSYVIAVFGGDATTPQSWAFEAVANYEIIGGRFPPTPSEGDAVGYAAALASLPVNAPTTGPKAVLSQAMNNLAENVINQATYLMGGAVNIGTAYAARSMAQYGSNALNSIMN